MLVCHPMYPRDWEKNYVESCKMEGKTNRDETPRFVSGNVLQRMSFKTRLSGPMLTLPQLAVNSGLCLSSWVE